MKYIISLILSFSFFNISAQNFRHEFTDTHDSIKLQGLRLFLEIDSVYKVSDSSGVTFTLEIVNDGNKILRLTNPLYDTQLNIRFRLYNMNSENKEKKKLQLKEVSRWPNPKLAEGIKPYKLENVNISDEKISKDDFKKFWEIDTLDVKPGQRIRFDLNLYEHVIFDEQVRYRMHYEPLPKSEYYTIFNVSLDIGNYHIHSKPLRFKLRLE